MFTEDDCYPFTNDMEGDRADLRNVVMEEVAHEVS